MKKLLTVGLFLFSGSVFAADGVKFACETRDGRVVQVAKVGDKYRYSFGKRNSPELVFFNTIQQIRSQTEPQDPHTVSYSSGMTFKNGAYTYDVYSGYNPRAESESKRYEQGVNVSRGMRYINTVSCVPKTAYINWEEEFSN